MRLSNILVICCLAGIILGQLPPIVQKEAYFTEQLVDHFSPLDNRTWSQRYFVIDQFYNPQNGPIILYICGEYTCPGLPEARHWPAYLAQMYQALIVVPEHRYYGKSMPFQNDSLKLENLQYLTVDQALADLANFIVWFKETNQNSASVNTPVLTIGGSYPGAMSAWFKYKYPHLTIGALASSAVVNSILDFYQFDQQIRTSALLSGQYCADAIHNVNFYVQQQLANPVTAQQIKSQFNATNVSNGQFLYYFADIFVELIQYGSRTTLCSTVQGKNNTQVLQLAVEYASNNSITADGYSSYYLKNTTLTPDYSGSRSWTYQYCTQFGWFQTAPANSSQSMRGTWVNLTMYQGLCSESFNFSTIGQQKTVWPDVQNTNVDWGGLGIEGFNLIFTNGVEDPWRWAGLQQSQGAMLSMVINCTDCAHCVDLYTPTLQDAQTLKNARTVEVYYFGLWLNDYWNNNQQGQPQISKPQYTDFMKEYLQFDQIQEYIVKKPNKKFLN